MSLYCWNRLELVLSRGAKRTSNKTILPSLVGIMMAAYDGPEGYSCYAHRLQIYAVRQICFCKGRLCDNDGNVVKQWGCNYRYFRKILSSQAVFPLSQSAKTLTSARRRVPTGLVPGQLVGRPIITRVGIPGRGRGGPGAVTR